MTHRVEIHDFRRRLLILNFHELLLCREPKQIQHYTENRFYEDLT